MAAPPPVVDAPDRFAVVVVGDKRVIEVQIRALDLGPIETLQADDLFE